MRIQIHLYADNQTRPTVTMVGPCLENINPEDWMSIGTTLQAAAIKMKANEPAIDEEMLQKYGPAGATIHAAHSDKPIIPESLQPKWIPMELFEQHLSPPD